MLTIKIPNILTLMRIVLIPVFIGCYFIQNDYGYWLTTAIFLLACLTDWLDGYLARRLGQETRFGAFLDPVADKLIVVVALILLVQSYGDALLSVPALMIISREIVISALREVMAVYGSSARVAVTYIGKVKTFLQMLAIVLLLSQPRTVVGGTMIGFLGLVMLYVAMLLTIWSMLAYFRSSWGVLRGAD